MQVGHHVAISPKSGHTMYVKVTQENLEGLRAEGVINSATRSAVHIYAKARGVWQYGVTHYDNERTVHIWTVVDVVKIDIPEKFTLKVGEKYTFEPKITDEKATTTITWTSSDASIVSISDNGTIQANNPGTATITATASNGVMAKSTVTVNGIKIKSIEFQNELLEMVVNESQKLTPLIYPDNATNKSLIWSSSDESIAKVSPNGLVLAIAEGNAFISATTKDGSELTASCLIKVKEPIVPISLITLTPTEISDYIGTKHVLNVNIYPPNASNKNLNYISSDPNVATVNIQGNIELCNAGNTTIFVEALDGSGVSAKCEVSVLENAGINDILMDENLDVRIFNLNGVCIHDGKYSNVALLPGVYLVVTRDKRILTFVK